MGFIGKTLLKLKVAGPRLRGLNRRCQRRIQKEIENMKAEEMSAKREQTNSFHDALNSLWM
jgi:hypothetical protein